MFLDPSVYLSNSNPPVEVVEPLVRRVVRQHVERVHGQVLRVQPRPFKHLRQRLTVVHHDRAPLGLELVPHEVHELPRRRRRREVDVVVDLHRPVEVGPKQPALRRVLGRAVDGDVHLERGREHLEALEGEGPHGARGGHGNEAVVVGDEGGEVGDRDEVGGAPEVGRAVYFGDAVGAQDVLEARWSGG